MPRREWEYDIQPLGITKDEHGIDDAVRDLNEMGADGWEIIAILPPNEKGWYLAFAKRPAGTHDEEADK